MNDSTTRTPTPDLEQVRLGGRLEGLAIAAVGVGLVSFLNLLGAEKSVLAIVLGVIAVSGSSSRFVRRRSWFAIGLGTLHLATVAVVLVLFQDEFGRLLQLLHKLG